MSPPEDAPVPDPKAGSAGSVRLTVDPRRLVVRLAVIWVAVEIGLLVLDYHVNLSGVHVVGSLRRMTNLAREDSLGNLLAVIQVMLLALTLWAVYWTVRRSEASKWQRRGWLVAALFFSYIALDDGARIHERFGTAAEVVLEAWAASSGREFVEIFPSYGWHVIYLPLFGALGLFTLYFMWTELQPEHSRTLIVIGISCFVVAVCMDFLEGLDESHRLNPYTWIGEQVNLSQWAYKQFHRSAFGTLQHFSKIVEEVIEMFGTTVIWIAVLRHWTRSVSELRIRFD
jgi:hypothetical protein